MFQLVPNPTLDFLLDAIIFMVAIYNYLCLVRNKKGTGYGLLLVLIIIYSLFYRPVGGDFWSYYEEYTGLKYGRHMEDYYYWLIDIIPNNYLLWRMAVWVPAAIFITLVFLLMKVPSKTATVFFLLFGLASYYYTRNALALSVLYLAVAVYSVKGGIFKKLAKYFIFGSLLLLSWYLHRSMPLYIGTALVALFLPFSRKYIFGAFLVFPLLYGATTLISLSFLEINDIWVKEGIGVDYLESENLFSANWMGVIGMLLRYMPVFYFYYIAFMYPVKKGHEDFTIYKSFLLMSFFIIFISFLFLGQGSASIQGRLYKSALIPFSFTVAIYFKHYVGNKRCRTFVNLILVYYAWKTLVTLM